MVTSCLSSILMPYQSSPYLSSHVTSSHMRVLSGYFIFKNLPGLWTFQSTQELSWKPLLVGKPLWGYVGITSSCLLVVFLFSAASRPRIYVNCLYCWASVSWTCNCARLLIVATLVLKAAVKSRLHGNNVCDIITGHIRSVDAQTKIQTGTENVKQP